MVYAVRLDSATTLALCLELDVALKTLSGTRPSLARAWARPQSVAGAGLICVGVLILTLSPRVEQSTNGVGVHEGDQPAGGGAPSHGSDKLPPPGVPHS